MTATNSNLFYYAIFGIVIIVVPIAAFIVFSMVIQDEINRQSCKEICNKKDLFYDSIRENQCRCITQDGDIKIFPIT